MAVHPPLRLLSMHRLVPVLTDSRPPPRLINILRGRGTTRTFSAAPLRWKESGGGGSGPSGLGTKLTSSQLLRARRPLSPVERVSRLLPQEALSPELKQLREQNQQHLDGDDLHHTQEEGGAEGHVASDLHRTQEEGGAEGHVSSDLHRTQEEGGAEGHAASDLHWTQEEGGAEGHVSSDLHRTQEEGGAEGHVSSDLHWTQEAGGAEGHVSSDLHRTQEEGGAEGHVSSDLHHTQEEGGAEGHVSSDLHRTQEEGGAEGHVSSDLHWIQEAGGAEGHVSSDLQEGGTSSQQGQRVWSSLPGDSPLTFGELLMAEHRRKGRVEFRKMFQLETGARLQSSWGSILHDHIAGRPAGRFLRTSRGVLIFIRRAALEDYVLHMRRGPAISYPKDAAAMLLMMDVTEGDCVLESGSGSGAMTLLLSRAVGSKGSVLSVEVREDHHRRARLNYERWRTAWGLRRGQDWPDNVQFYRADLSAPSSLLSGRGLHAVALDMMHPHLALPTVLPHLHPGAVCAVYLANITQVIDLLEGLRCSALPFLCERIIEVPVRDWFVAPARQKDGQYCTRRSSTLKEEELTADGDTGPAFGTVPYIARPHPEQMSHTAFLIKLRKCVH